MRPVNKGPDRGSFDPYKNAQQPLIDRLGEYCSSCERWVCSAIHVEHKRPKEDYPAEKTLWSNFLLSCPNCNSGKGHGPLNLADYLWPDSDNTFRAFRYDAEGRVYPLSGFGPVLDRAVLETWLMYGFNRHPDRYSPDMEMPTPKDKRWHHRREAWQKAETMKKKLSVLDTPERREEIIEIAAERGMFSIWMAVFHDDPDILRRLIEKFPGTAVDCFDEEGKPVARPGGRL